MTATVLHGDCRELMAGMDPASVDAIVCDPPYGLSFMGKGWDHGVPGVEFWTAARRVAKPGAYLLAFGGTRTFHRLTCAIEDAGWQIQDCLSWLYGSGFPKHKSKLKPAWEPVVMARNPDKKATPLNIEACRIATAETISLHGRNPTENGWDARWSGGQAKRQTAGQVLGRWPANVVIDEDAAAAIDEQSGERGGGGGGVGGASRFYYCAKAGRAEREAGLDGMAAQQRGTLNDYARPSEGRTAPKSGGSPTRNPHPTVKPVALMRWLVRLVTPPDGLVLDPFCGSGSTGIAAVQEGRRFLGLEREAEYVEIARARIAHALLDDQPTLGK